MESWKDAAGVAFFFSGLECTSEEGDIGQDRIPDARGMWHRFGEKAGRQRERISARARTPSGDTTKVP